MIIKSLFESLQKCGVNRGDIVSVSSNVASFGLPSEIKKEVFEKGPNYLLDSYIETFVELVGKDGHVLMPAFTYSATKGEVFCLNSTPSVVGVLTERFRNKRGVERSQHPIFSYCCFGPNSEEIVQLSSYNCFGKGSFFEKMLNLNVKHIMFGIEMGQGATYVYHAEKMHNVKYRYDKEFLGKVRMKSCEERNEKVSYFVRDYEFQLIDDWSYLQQKSIETGVTSVGYFQEVPFYLHESKKIHDLILQKLKEDEMYLVRASNDS